MAQIYGTCLAVQHINYTVQQNQTFFLCTSTKIGLQTNLKMLISNLKIIFLVANPVFAQIDLKM